MRLIENIQAPWVGNPPREEERPDWWDSDDSYNDRPLGWDDEEVHDEACDR